MEIVPVEKNKEYIVDIVDNGYDGEGIAKIENFIVFVNGAIKNEVCKIAITKVKKDFAYGRIIEVIQKSNNRIDEDCNTYKRCGGCSLRHIDYLYTLQMKQKMVQMLVDKTLNSRIEVQQTIGMEYPYFYRNKLQYPIGISKDNKPTMGVFAKRTHEIIPVENCYIQNQTSEQIAKYIFELIKKYNISVYDERIAKGKIRHIVIKIGIKTNEIMCILVTNEEEIGQESKLVEDITKKFSNIKTVIKNVNNQNTNVILGKKNIVLYGDGYIYDKLGEYTFKISPMSFYQTNPIQTEKLYNKAIEYANLNEEDVLCDLYCGIGTIGIFAARHVKKVYGIEIVEEAIQDAKENAKINEINNIEFISGDVEKVFQNMIEQKRIFPTAIIVDPPRKGLDNTTIQTILSLNVKKFVYVSCNPSTLVRDLKILEGKYNVKQIQPVDMFPFTSHVECVAVLQLK